MANFTEETVSVAGSKLQVYKGGAGEPLLVLHGAGGNAGPRRYAQALAEKFTVYLPSHPGYGKSERPGWVETMPDLACFYTWYQEQEGLEQVRVIGFSMGGWLAAEMMTMTGHAFRKAMLVGAAGIKPQQGEITDIFIISPQQVRDLVYHDPAQVPEWAELFGSAPTPEQAETAERDREMAIRLTWRPYMHNPRLPAKLGRVSIPTHIVWGAQDNLVPVECAGLYQQAIAGAEVTVIPNCGHSPQIEKPDEFARTALAFL